MEKVLPCSICNLQNTHLITTFSFTDNDSYVATNVEIDGRININIDTQYNYRSQGNIHLLFLCEDGHYFAKSFDGHKGGVFLDTNSPMDKLVKFLNENETLKDDYTFTLSDKLLGIIVSYFSHLSRGNYSI